jgi:hypothetical protein
MQKQILFKKIVDTKKPDKGHYEQVHMDGGFLVGHVKVGEKLELVFDLLGDIGFDDAIDDVMSAIYHMCSITYIESGSTKEAREEIYKRVVQAFSLIMDKFNPEAKDRRSDLMSEEEMQAYEEIIKENKELKKKNDVHNK